MSHSIFSLALARYGLAFLRCILKGTVLSGHRAAALVTGPFALLRSL